MSEPIPDAPVEPATPIEPAAQLPETDWKAEARKWEQRSKENAAQVAALKPQADQFRALEQASMSETQRLSEQAATSQREAETARSEAIRYKAAATHGIPAEHFDLLGTGSEEQVTANAQKIAALLAAQAAAVPPVTPVTPGRLAVEQMRPGATPAGTESEDDVVYAALFGSPK